MDRWVKSKKVGALFRRWVAEGDAGTSGNARMDRYLRHAPQIALYLSDVNPLQHPKGVNDYTLRVLYVAVDVGDSQKETLVTGKPSSLDDSKITLARCSALGGESSS